LRASADGPLPSSRLPPQRPPSRLPEPPEAAPRASGRGSCRPRPDTPARRADRGALSRAQPTRSRYTYVFHIYWPRMRHRSHPRSRNRRLVRPGHWDVRARVERYVERSLLLLLRERPLHGYELLERIPELGVEGRVDIGNLYRLLRALEEGGVRRSGGGAG